MMHLINTDFPHPDLPSTTTFSPRLIVRLKSFSDVVPAFIKTFFFGFAIGLIGCYKGYNSKKGTEGVGRSANSAVVIGSLLVFIIDLIAVQITEFFGFL